MVASDDTGVAAPLVPALVVVLDSALEVRTPQRNLASWNPMIWSSGADEGITDEGSTSVYRSRSSVC